MSIPGLSDYEARAFRILQKSVGKKRKDIQMTFGQLYDLVDDLKIGTTIRLNRGGSLARAIVHPIGIIFRPCDFSVTHRAVLRSCFEIPAHQTKEIRELPVYVQKSNEWSTSIVDYEINPDGTLVLHTEFLDWTWN